MGVPDRFVTEYPARCRQLLDILEKSARKAELVGSLALLVASAAFNIPFARMSEKKHPLGKPEDQLFSAVKGLKNQPFTEAELWNGSKPTFFRYAKILTDVEDSRRWRDANGSHPLHSTESKDGNTVLRVIRNALAHGNVVYLDKNRHETPGSTLVYLAFLSEVDSGPGYRVAIFDEESFLAFLKCWIAWLQTFPPESKFQFVEAAE